MAGMARLQGAAEPETPREPEMGPHAFEVRFVFGRWVLRFVQKDDDRGEDRDA
jgi:hypothetical protein